MTNEDQDEEDYTPRIVVLGAGPIGIETALYARYLGYEVAVVERASVANNVKRWGHVQMFSPFTMNRSTLGVAALQAQFESMNWPADDAMLTGDEFADSYLLPLSKTDLLAGCIHENVEVISVARDGILKTDTVDLDREEFQFRVLVRGSDGEDTIEADVVIDTTGVFDQPNFIGHGGLPALGELESSPAFHAHLPDILGSQRAEFDGKRVLVVGNGYSAATNIVALAELSQQNADTKTTWLTRRESPPAGPIPVADNDRLPERNKLSEMANAATKQSGVQHADQTSVLAVSKEANGAFRVTLGGKLTGDHQFDSIISCTGYRPNTSISRELQIDLCAATEAPQPMSDWFQSLGTIDAVEQTSPGVQTLQNPEPNFFVLGSKSFGRNSNFLLALGLQQIRDAFAHIADREELDLYKTMSNLV